MVEGCVFFDFFFEYIVDFLIFKQPLKKGMVASQVEQFGPSSIFLSILKFDGLGCLSELDIPELFESLSLDEITVFDSNVLQV